VERGESTRWRIISPAQAYHGATMGALALSGRPALQAPYEKYLTPQLHISPTTWRFDPTGEAALDELDRRLEEAGPETVAAFFCEPVSAAALPGHTPPDRFWLGLAERRERYGFLVCFDEIVTGMGRTGTWFAYQQLPIQPDIVTVGKALGAGYAPLAATMCREHVYAAVAAGSREFEHGHTWDGAPLPCAVGLAVLNLMLANGLVEHVRSRGPRLHDELEAALAGLDIVGEIRGRGFLLGIELVDPRDGQSILPDALNVADMVDDVALEHGVLVTSSHPNRDGYASDQVLLAPAYTSTDVELAAMLDRVAAALAHVESRVREALH
jgi:adenosylmethionine-8-amino-7-oxononanoate aminotransferase